MIPYTNKQNKRVLGQEIFISSESHIVGILGVNTPSQSSYFVITQVADSTHLFVNSSTGMSIGNTVEQNGISTTITNVNSSIEITVTSTVGFAVGVCFLVINTPTMIKLVEVPRQDFPSSVFVSGYLETTNPNPASGQFFVDYSVGYITFNQNASGNSVSATYYGRGSEIDSIDANEIQQPLSASLDIDGTFTPNRLIYGLLSVTNPSGTLPTNYVDNYTGLVVTATTTVTITFPSPSNTSKGRIFTVLNSSTSTNSITVNGSTLTIGSGASWLWDGSSWDSISGSGGGSGITQLTGDVTAGPGSGSQAATLATVNSNVGSFTNTSITVNAKGLITAASSSTAPVTSVSGTAGDISSTGGTTPVLDLVNTAVTPGSYTNTNLTVDAKGRITAASNSTAVTPGGTNTDIQFNNSGSFGGSSNLTYDGNTLGVTGTSTPTVPVILVTDNSGNFNNATLEVVNGSIFVNDALTPTAQGSVQPGTLSTFDSNGANTIGTNFITTQSTTGVDVTISLLPENSTPLSWAINALHGTGQLQFQGFGTTLPNNIVMALNQNGSVAINGNGGNNSQFLTLQDIPSSGGDAELYFNSDGGGTINFNSSNQGTSFATLMVDSSSNVTLTAEQTGHVVVVSDGNNSGWNWDFQADGGLKFNLLATRPASPVEGEVIYNSGTHHVEYWNGTTWVTL